MFVAQALPGFLVAAVAGAAADRYDRRRIIVTVSAIQAVAALALLGVGPGRVWLAFLAQATVAAFGAFVVPASQAAVPNLARGPDELKKATALFGSTWGAMLAIGAALGGALHRHVRARRIVRGRCGLVRHRRARWCSPSVGRCRRRARRTRPRPGSAPWPT